MSSKDNILLSICIATYKRSGFIGETLQSIFKQNSLNIEIILVDGNSPDNTAETVLPYLKKYDNFKYFKESENSGVDRDYDKAVGYAQGKYCWLMTDDDLMVPGAINYVLSALINEPNLVVINAKIMSVNFSALLQDKLILVEQDRWYADTSSGFFRDACHGLTFIGSVVINRSIWISRDRKTYFGTEFIHVGVIFQLPYIEDVLLIAQPLISIRYGNAMWGGRGFEVWMFKWPNLIWSFKHYSAALKNLITPRNPWMSFKKLSLMRANGAYSKKEYIKYIEGSPSLLKKIIPVFIMCIPATILNLALIIYLSAFKKNSLVALYDLKRSKYSMKLVRKTINQCQN